MQRSTPMKGIERVHRPVLYWGYNDVAEEEDYADCGAEEARERLPRSLRPQHRPHLRQGGRQVICQ